MNRTSKTILSVALVLLLTVASLEIPLPHSDLSLEKNVAYAKEGGNKGKGGENKNNKSKKSEKGQGSKKFNISTGQSFKTQGSNKRLQSQKSDSSDSKVEVDDNNTVTSKETKFRGKAKKIELKLKENGKVNMRMESNDGSEVEDETTGGNLVLLEKVKSKLKIKAKGDVFEIESTSEDETDAVTDPNAETDVESTDEGTVADTTDGTETDGETDTTTTTTATTKFPLSIDPATNTLTITTPSGNVHHVILPDAAVRNFIRNGKATVISSTSLEEGDDTTSGTEDTTTDETTGDGTTVDDTQTNTDQTTTDTEITTDDDEAQTEDQAETEVEEQNDTTQTQSQIVYRVKGFKKVKLLGIVPVKINVGGDVDAESGEITSTTQPWYVTYLGFLFTK